MSMQQQPPVPGTPDKHQPFFIGAGVPFEGTVRHTGKQDEAAVVQGEFKGDIDWNGTLHVPAGGKILVGKNLRCREMVVAGEIVGGDDSAVVETGILRMEATARVEVATVSVAPGGLEQARGAVVNGRLRMHADNAFAEAVDARQSALLAPTPPLRAVLAIARSTNPSAHGVDSEDAPLRGSDGDVRPLGGAVAA